MNRILFVAVVVQFYPWFNLYFLLFFGMVMYDNEIKQKKIKIKPRIKLNHNIAKHSWMTLHMSRPLFEGSYLICSSQGGLSANERRKNLHWMINIIMYH